MVGSMRSALRGCEPVGSLPDELKVYLTGVQEEHQPVGTMFIGLEGQLAQSYEELGKGFCDGGHIEHWFGASGVQGASIEKDLDVLTREELNTNWKEVSAGKLKEILGLSDLNCFRKYSTPPVEEPCRHQVGYDMENDRRETRS